ncbi:NfeD family protein [Tuwongella immobilis]|nr:NfeD family protein [Tuwongella immobilis]
MIAVCSSLCSRGLLPLWMVVFTTLLTGSAFGQAAAANAPPVEEGLFITVPNPITSDVVTRIRATTQTALNHPKRPIRKFIFDFTPNGKEAATRDYGVAYELSKEIKELTLNGGTTIAFLTGKVTLHSVLPVLACSEIAMSTEAKIGQVVEPNSPLLPRNELDYYLTLAGPNRAAVVLKMIDRNAEILKGLRNGATFYLDARKRNDEAFRDVQGIDPTPVMVAGAVELYSAEMARRYGLANTIKETRQDVAEAYRLSPASLQEDKLQGRQPAPWKIVVRGEITGAMRETLNRRFRYVMARGGNMIFLQLECSGGNPEDAAGLADDIRNLTDASGAPVVTVAYIPMAAPDLATFLALACDEIVMAKGKPGTEQKAAELGDFDSLVRIATQVNRPADPDDDDFPLPKNRKGADKKDKKGGPPDFAREEAAAQIPFIQSELQELATNRGISKLLIEGLFNADLAIVRVRSVKDATRREIMTEEQFQQENRDAQTWIFEGNIKERGKLLKLDAMTARDVGLVRYLTDNRDINEVFPQFGIESSTVQEATPDWLDGLASFLRRPEISVLLVMVGIGCLILELKVPGLTVAGLTSAFCFVMFFWAQSQMSGQIVYLAALLFILGIVFLGVEIFVLPGFGITGLAGIVLMLVGLGLASVDRVPQSSAEWGNFGATILQYSLSVVVAGIGTFFLARYLPNIPYVNRLVLPPVEADAAAESTPLPGAELAAALLGAIGVTATVLRPAGMAKFEDSFVDVVSDGSYIAAGERVQVIEVEGTRIVVKKV